jgi:predicted porin
MWADDGQVDNVFHVDNDASSTRLRVIGETDVSDGLTAGVAIEVQFESNSSARVNIDDETEGDDNFTKRRLEVYFDNKQYGKLWMGQGWTASEGTSEVDLSGTDMAGYSDMSVLAGSIKFREISGMLSETDVGDAFNNFDGQGRNDRLRYDTPTFGGFTVSASVIEEDAWDTAIRYAADYGGTKVAGALAYSEPESSTVDNQVNGSVSVRLQGGLNFTLAAGERDLVSGTDPSFYYVKLGYQTRIIDAGTTSFSVDYNRSDDNFQDGDEATAFGLQMVQKFDAWSTEAYLGWRTYELDRLSADLQDVDAVIAGARVKF